VTRHPRWARRLFSGEDLEAIARAVAGAEQETSGEIRVHLERRAPRPGGREAADVLARARAVFVRLGMPRTAQRNGVLLYLSIEDHTVAIVGDEGIHARVGDDYWARIRDAMVERLRRGDARAAVVEAVAEVGRTLARHFPRIAGDVNELGDDVSLR
jgi:uncharacterized membrane protein